MTPKLSNELAQALDAQGGKLTVEHPVTGQRVVIIMGQRLEEEMRKVLYDDSELSPEEMLAAAASTGQGESGWDAPGMDVYDGPKYDAPKNQQ